MAVLSDERQGYPSNPASKQLSQAFHDLDEFDLLSERQALSRRRLSKEQGGAQWTDVPSPRQPCTTQDIGDSSEQQIDSGGASPRLRRASGLQPAFMSEDIIPADDGLLSTRTLPGRILRRIRRVRELPALQINVGAQSVSEPRSHSEESRRRSSLSLASYVCSPGSMRTTDSELTAGGSALLSAVPAPSGQDPASTLLSTSLHRHVQSVGKASSCEGSTAPLLAEFPAPSKQEQGHSSTYMRGSALLQSGQKAQHIGDAVQKLLLEVSGHPVADISEMLDSPDEQKAFMSLLKENFVPSEQDHKFALDLYREVQEEGLMGVEALRYALTKRFGTLKEAFFWLDLSGCGHFSRVALETAAVLLHIDVEKLTGAKSQEIFSRMDARQTSTVSRDDWAQFFGVTYSDMFGMDQITTNKFSSEGSDLSVGAMSTDYEEVPGRPSEESSDTTHLFGRPSEGSLQNEETETSVGRYRLYSHSDPLPPEPLPPPEPPPARSRPAQDGQRLVKPFHRRFRRLAPVAKEVERRSEPSTSAPVQRRRSIGQLLGAIRRGSDPASEPEARPMRATSEQGIRKMGIQEQKSPKKEGQEPKEHVQRKQERETRKQEEEERKQFNEDTLDDGEDAEDEEEEDEEQDDDFRKRLKNELLKLKLHERRVYAKLPSHRCDILGKVVRDLNLWSFQKGSDIIVLHLPDRDSILHSLR